MLYEFAVDPACIDSWDRCRYILEAMGTSKGRMIAAFPKRKQWLKMLHEALDARNLPDKERKRIEVKVGNIGRKFSGIRSGYNAGITWLDNAITQRQLKPFRAIVTRDGHNDDEKILAVDDIDETTPLWNVQVTRKVPMTKKDMKKHVASLLQISREIRFVDPYFDPRESRWREILEGCLEAAAANERKLERVEYHTVVDRFNSSTQKYERHMDDLYRACQKHLPQVLPPKERLHVIFWKVKHQPFHARYILTDRGGYQVETGLNAGHPGKRQDQDVTLMQEKIKEQCWNRFNSDANIYEHCGEVPVCRQKQIHR